jgi:hypothetical protein
VEEDLEKGVARNEATFRDVNEALARGHWPGEDEPTAYRCECGRLGCSRMIELRPADYERIREHPRRFLIAPDHEISEVETVVETHTSYVVVEKRDEAGRVTEATDPRA